MRLGARVLLLTNVSDQLVNGMLGVVERWATPAEVEAALVEEERKPAHVSRCVLRTALRALPDPACSCFR